MTTPTINDERPQRAPGDKPSPRPRGGAHRARGRNVVAISETTAPRTDATAVVESGDTSTPAAPAPEGQDTPTGGEPRGIEHARLAAILTRTAGAGAALMIGAGGALGAFPPHRWPRVGMALVYLALAGMSLLIGAGMSRVAIWRERPADE